MSSIKVRIAVVVDDAGLWSAAGNCAYEMDEEVIEGANDYMPQESTPRRNVVWLETKVPVPPQNSAGELSCDIVGISQLPDDEFAW